MVISLCSGSIMNGHIGLMLGEQGLQFIVAKTGAPKNLTCEVHNHTVIQSIWTIIRTSLNRLWMGHGNQDVDEG